MNGCELVTLVSTLACIISQDKTTDEIALLATVFTQLGDSLATITITREQNSKLKN